jgi:hypothetical protein
MELMIDFIIPEIDPDLLYSTSNNRIAKKTNLGRVS